MKIKNAVSRIFWRFGGNDNKHPFPVNEDDIKAYNRIKDYVQEKEQEQFANNELFAKMFILMYMKVLEKDGGTVYNNLARKKITQFLQMPLGNVIQKFTDFLNETDREQLYKDLGIDLKHPLTTSDEQKGKDAEKVKEALKKPENMKIFTGNSYDTDFVEECLIAEVNQVIELCT